MRGERAEKKGHAGKEYWGSRLHKHGELPSKFTKKMTHKKERNRTIILKILKIVGDKVECGLRSYEDLHNDLEKVL